MKLYLLAAVLSVGIVNAAHAQSLDIGGVELHIGEKVDKALPSLSSYEVQYKNVGADAWFVSQKVGNIYQPLGYISVNDGVITSIGKYFDVGDDVNTPQVYTRAAGEIRRRGGKKCNTYEEKYNDGNIRGFSTWCGRYKLTYTMSFKDNDGRRYVSSISISIVKNSGR